MKKETIPKKAPTVNKKRSHPEAFKEKVRDLKQVLATGSEVLDLKGTAELKVVQEFVGSLTY